MKKITLKKLAQLRQRCEEAKQALFLEPGYPCRGQVYPYQRGTNHYYKWQRREGGKRIQHTLGVAAMETLLAGIVARKQFEERLQQYYSTCEQYALAKTQIEVNNQKATSDKKKLR